MGQSKKSPLEKESQKELRTKHSCSNDHHSLSIYHLKKSMSSCLLSLKNKAKLSTDGSFTKKKEERLLVSLGETFFTTDLVGTGKLEHKS